MDDGCVWSRPDDAVKAHPDRTALTDIDLDTPSELRFGHPGFDNLGDVGTCFIHQCTCTSDGIDFLRLFDCFDWFDDAACWNKVDRRWKSANEGVPRINRQRVRLDRKAACEALNGQDTRSFEQQNRLADNPGLESRHFNACLQEVATIGDEDCKILGNQCDAI